MLLQYHFPQILRLLQLSLALSSLSLSNSSDAFCIKLEKQENNYTYHDVIFLSLPLFPTSYFLFVSLSQPFPMLFNNKRRNPRTPSKFIIQENILLTLNKLYIPANEKIKIIILFINSFPFFFEYFIFLFISFSMVYMVI